MKQFVFLVTIIMLACACTTQMEELPTQDVTEMDVIKLGLSASSSHNAQPWKVISNSDGTYTIESIEARWLPEVDPDNRELLISMGILIETLSKSAAFYGFDFKFDLSARDSKDTTIGRFTLVKNGSAVDVRSLNILRSIYNDKTSYQPMAIDNPYSHSQVRYYSSDSAEFQILKSASLEANDQQVKRENVQEELSHFFVFSDQEKQAGIGVTPEMIDFPGILTPIWYWFWDKDFVLSEDFASGTVPKVEGQIDNSAGFVVITSEGTSIADLIATGRLYQDVLFVFRQNDIEMHPISQIMEESPWAETVAVDLGLTGDLQMVLRVGKKAGRQVNYELDAISSATIRADYEDL